MKSEIEEMPFLPLLLFSLLSVWTDAQEGSNSRKAEGEKRRKEILHPITIKASKSPLTMSHLPATTGLEIVSQLTSCGLEETKNWNKISC